MVEFVFNLLIYIFNTVIFLFSKVLNLIFSLLPTSPFVDIFSFEMFGRSSNNYLGYLAWLLPIKWMVAILLTWLSCMALYYLYSCVMRWIKLID